jgi:uncharacterized membrane protein YidH (DUF202 family)
MLQCARNNMPESESNPEQKKSGLGVFQVIYSVLAAMFGVQNHERHKRDFEEGDPMQFIVVGIGFVVAFVFGIIWLVNSILEQQ